MLTVLLLFASERDAKTRLRLVALGAVGVVLVSIALGAVLSLPAVSELFKERASIEQSYDTGHLGRFARYGIGFNLMLDHPLGLGATEFGDVFGEDEHDIWLKTLTTYGWLGFASYLSLVIWTLVAAFPPMFRSGPLQSLTQVAYVVFVGHVLIATVIDIDHWRHVYLLFGVLWGAIAADKLAKQRRLGRNFLAPR